MPVGDWQPRETRLLADFLYETFPQGNYQTNVPLGRIPPSLEEGFGVTRARGLYRPYRPEIDAVAVTGTRLIFIEAKIQKGKKGLGDLIVYRDLVPETAELQRYKDLRHEYWLVVPYAQPWLKTAAAKQKILLKIFAPEWLQPYVKELSGYWTKEGQIRRDERKRALQEAGL